MRHKLPDVPSLDLCLYHWSPTINRSSILKYGLQINKRSLQGYWRPPYVAFSDDPLLAWALSGAMWPEFPNWDLWMVNFPTQTSFDGYEIILDTYQESGRHFVKEYRVYKRVFKRDLNYVASRTQ